MRVLWRTLAIWLIEAVALLILAWLLPGVTLDGIGAALGLALLIGVLNASLRPLLLAAALRLPLVLLALVAVFLNAAIIRIAAAFVPGVHIDNIWWALLASFGLGALNALFTGLLNINDDDSYYRNVVRRMARRQARGLDLSRPGLLIVQIDGLAAPVLRRALDEGRMPELARWLKEGSHRLVEWECDVPSMTSSGQAGIMHGNNANIPAFRWFEKESRRLMVSNHPRDAYLLDQRQSIGKGLLREQGSSNGNIFKAGADHYVLTMSGLTTADERFSMDARGLYPYLVNPYNLTRGIAGMAGELLLEYWQAWRQRRRNDLPRMRRDGAFPFLRAVSVIFMRDATVWCTISDVYSGQRVSYIDLLGYDEVAHHAGPSYPDALQTLHGIDHQLHRLEVAVRTAPRPFEIVVLSDHGQSQGATFRQRYGYTLDELIQRLLAGPADVHLSGGTGEGWGHLNAALTEMVQQEGMMGRGAQRLLGKRADGDGIELGPDRKNRAESDAADVVVCASGNLALVYFAEHPGRLSLEFIVASHPGLIEGLVQHEGIGFLLVQSELRGPVAMGAKGLRVLETDELIGEDPLARFSPHTAGFLKRLSTYPNVGDVVVNSLLDEQTGEVAAFEELIGCHGGAGGWQTRPFMMFPAAWTDTDPQIIGAEQVHAFLSRHLFGEDSDVAAVAVVEGGATPTLQSSPATRPG